MSKELRRIQTVIEKITHIQNIISKFNGKISSALDDRELHRPAILMHLVAIAEQFDKLKKKIRRFFWRFPRRI